MSVLSPKSAIVKQIFMLLHPIDDAVPIFYFQANPREATASVDMACGPLAYQRYIEHNKTL